jgi:hypothetical protein
LTHRFYPNHAYHPVKMPGCGSFNATERLAGDNDLCCERSPDLTVSATTSALASTSTTSALTILAQTTAIAAQTTNNREIKAIDQQIQNTLNAKIATLQQTPDAAVANALQSQITALSAQRTAVSQVASTAGANATILSDLQVQLANLQTAAASGNSAGFDATLSAANTDLLDLTTTSPPAPFQPNGIAGLQGKGLGIGSSASYNLSTPAGQTAAKNDVQAAQTLVGQVFQATTSNQLVADDIETSLSTQINTLTAQQQQQSQADQAATTAQAAHLTQLASNQTHLIELSLGTTSAVANMIAKVDNPPLPYTSVFQALEGAVGATPSSTRQQPAAILSLLA